MPAILQRVRRFIRQHDLIRPGARVVCALSGGSDSVALALILQEFAAAGDLCFAGVAHLNHQLRASADRDERFCRELAERLGRPILAERADVAARAAREGCSIEVAARRERYELFARARAQFDADVVAVGHTRDDQAETFLLRLLRGAGPRGLGGIHPRRGEVVRPLLDCCRADLRAFLADRGAAFVEDETNDDPAIPRNRVRRVLLPLLASEFNPAITDVLAREAALARDVWAWLEAEVDRFGAAERGHESGLDVASLRAAPLALRRLAVWRAMSAASAKPVTFRHVDAALALLDSSEGASIDAPGHRVHRNAGRLVLTSGSHRSQGARGSGGSRRPNLYRYTLSIPGEVTIGTGRIVSAVLLEPAAAELNCCADPRNARSALVRADLVGATLAVRNRRPGDRFRPVGVNGRKKLQDLFVDRKIARAERDSVPIIVDAADRIVWVAGHGIDEAFRVTEPAQGVLLLRLSDLEACS